MGSSVLYALLVLSISSKSFGENHTNGEYEIGPRREKMLGELITTMYLRSGSSLLDSGKLDGLKESLISKYFEYPVFRKFVIGFERYVYPRLTLQQGESCDPVLHDKYKDPETGVFGRYSVRIWVGAHLPEESGKNPDVPRDARYCDFRQGLVCDQTSKTCGCPTGSVLEDGDDPRLGSKKHCFLKATEPCHLVNLNNTLKTMRHLLKNLEFLIFQPDRPTACIPGTQCRFQAPHINIPRCWCDNSQKPAECTSAGIGWNEGQTIQLLASPTLNLGLVISHLKKSTSDFVAIYHGKDRDTEAKQESVVNKNYLTAASPQILEGYKKLRELDSGMTNLDVTALTQLKSELEKNNKCVKNLSEDLAGCLIFTASGNITCTSKDACDYPKTCTCYQSKSFKWQDKEMHVKYGHECNLRVNDDGAVCHPYQSKVTCYRWDLNQNSKGICSCPFGYGMRGTCDVRNPDTDGKAEQSLLLAFVNPRTVSLRSTGLEDYQEEVAKLDSFIMSEMEELDPNHEHECNPELNKRWEQIFEFYTGLEERAAANPPNPVTEHDLGPMLQTWKDLDEEMADADTYGKLCYLQKYYYCHDGKCKLDPSLKIFEGAKKMEDKLRSIIKYVSDSETGMDRIPDEDEPSCHGETFHSVAGAGLFSIRQPGPEGRCQGSAFCSENYEVIDFLDTDKCYLNPDREIKKVCRCSEKKEGEECNQDKTGGEEKQWHTCELRYLKGKLEIMVEDAIQGSVLTVGEECVPAAEKILDELRMDVEDNFGDWYYDMFRFKKVLSMAPNGYCNRQKFVTCKGETGRCECKPGTSQRVNADGTHMGDYCYPHEGSCERDPSGILPLFSAEEGEVLAHYGNPNENGVDPDGCVLNLCAYRAKGQKTCITNPVYSLFVESNAGSYHAMGASGPKVALLSNIIIIFIVYINTQTF